MLSINKSKKITAMKWLPCIGVLACLLLFAVPTHAQNKITVKGVVKDNAQQQQHYTPIIHQEIRSEKKFRVVLNQK